MSRPTDWNPSLWKDCFEELLDQELDHGDEWTLGFNYRQTDEVSMEDRKRGWKVGKQCAYGGFRCGRCSNTWWSAKVTLVFRYRLRKTAEKGTVIMRPFGQSCRSCHDDQDVFYMAGFSDDVVDRTLLQLFKKIRKNCYGEEQDGSDVPVCDIVRKTKPHKKELCEACQQGICCLEE
ncbi:unnamed protein product [Gadus morhua 'NCC']